MRPVHLVADGDTLCGLPRTRSEPGAGVCARCRAAARRRRLRWLVVYRQDGRITGGVEDLDPPGPRPSGPPCPVVPIRPAPPAVEPPAGPATWGTDGATWNVTWDASTGPDVRP